MEHKIYTFDKIRVFFKHTDYYGYVHPYNYLEWMSYAREAYFQDLVPNFMELCQKNIKMVTTLMEYRHNGDVKFGDEVLVKIFSRSVRRLSFDVVFQFYCKCDSRLLGEGLQRLTFLDGETGRPERIPSELKCKVLLYDEGISANE